MTDKTNKELAFLHDLFVAPDWGERFAELIDEQIKLPKAGQALYLAAGTGSHAIALQERAGEALKFLGVDENEENLEVARAKATTLKLHTEFRHGTVDRLDLDDGQFSLVIGDGSLVRSERVPAMIAEMARVAATGATVALALPSFASFGEFFSIYWEALHNLGLDDHKSDVETLITILPSVSALEEMAAQAGLEEVGSVTTSEAFDYDSADKFLSAPLISDFLMPVWLDTLTRDSYEEVVKEIGRLIVDEHRAGKFLLTVKATVVFGKKALGR